MSNVIKVKLELANNGTEYNNGSVISQKTQYVETISESVAATLFLAGKNIYFVYENDKDIHELWMKKCNNVNDIEKHYHCGDTCGIILNKHMLSDDEYELINKLAGLSGMACWFMLCSTGDEYEVHDLEDGVSMSLSKGIKTLSEGIFSLDDYSCTDYEKTVFTTLCERLNINYNA